MSLGLDLQPIKQLAVAVFQPALENAAGSCLVNDLGMVNFRTYDSPRELIYRRKNNPGGTLSVRNKGENLKTTSTGLTYVDEKAGTVKFGNVESVLISDILGNVRPEAVNITQDPLTIADTARRQFEILMTKLNNTARSFASFRFTRSITVGGITINNDVIQTGTTFPITWANLTDAKPINDLIDLKANYFGVNKPAQALTILASTKQIINLLKNTQIAQQLGLTRIIDDSAQVVTTLAQLNSILIAYNIRIYEWNEGYYTNPDSGFLGDITYFLDPDQITVIPGYYTVRNQADPILGLTEVRPGSSNAPFVDVIMVPDADFAFKQQTNQSLNTVGGNMNGAYFYTGIPWSNPGTPAVYETAVAIEMGAYAAKESFIKSIIVQP